MEAKEVLIQEDFNNLLTTYLMFRKSAHKQGLCASYFSTENLASNELLGLFKLWYETRGFFLVHSRENSDRRQES